MLRRSTLSLAFLALSPLPAYPQSGQHDCPPSVPRDSLRLALALLDERGQQFITLARITLGGKSVGGEEKLVYLATPSQGNWYCSAILPRGYYTLEVRAHLFERATLRFGSLDTGLVIRTLQLTPDPWRPDSAQYATVPHLSFVKSERPYDAQAHFVDSVQVGDSTVTVYGNRSLPAIGYGLTAHLTALGSHLILDIIETPPSEVANMVVPLRYQATISGLGRGPYRLVVRDLPLGAFTAFRGYSSIINTRIHSEVDVRRLEP